MTLSLHCDTCGIINFAATFGTAINECQSQWSVHDHKKYSWKIFQLVLLQDKLEKHICILQPVTTILLEGFYAITQHIDFVMYNKWLNWI